MPDRQETIEQALDGQQSTDQEEEVVTQSAPFREETGPWTGESSPPPPPGGTVPTRGPYGDPSWNGHFQGHPYFHGHPAFQEGPVTRKKVKAKRNKVKGGPDPLPGGFPPFYPSPWGANPHGGYPQGYPHPHGGYPQGYPPPHGGYPQGHPHPHGGYPQGHPHPHGGYPHPSGGYFQEYLHPHGNVPPPTGEGAPSSGQDAFGNAEGAGGPDKTSDHADQKSEKDFMGDFIKSPIPNISALLGMDDMDFWKGAVLGAAAMMLISSRLNQNDD